MARQASSEKPELGSGEEGYHSKRLRVNELYFDQLRSDVRPVQCNEDEQSYEILAIREQLDEMDSDW